MKQLKLNIMKTINATVGYRNIHDDGTITYHGDYTMSGMIYLDLDAWEKGSGVIYISEYALGENDFDDVWRRENWLEWVADDLRYRYGIEDLKVAEKVASDILYETKDYGWADLATYLDQYELSEHE